MNADAELFRDAIEYFPETGLFVWKISPGNRVRAGSIAGTLNRQGYRVIRYKNHFYRAHSIAWLLVTGEWPDRYVDHRNLNKSDNSWSNLRLATVSQNNANRRARSKFGKGVYQSQYGKFKAIIRVNSKNYYLGTFNTSEEAATAYANEAIKHFGEFARVI